MAVSAFLVETAPPIVKWGLMSERMLKGVKISFDPRVWGAVFAPQFVREASLTSKIEMKMAGTTNQFCWETIVLQWHSSSCT